MDYDVVIGLEVHVELLSKSKMFCGCSTEFGGRPNSNCCPICLGFPGTLPVLNKKVLELSSKAAIALNCEIPEYNKFDRKNYFYPDLPKAYQISQFDLPIAKNGFIEIETKAGAKKIRINRIHLEEDAGKLVHSPDGKHSLVDYNRGGVPLIEIVTEPDITTSEEAELYLTKLKSILQYTQVSDCKMQEGSLRCDANVSIKPKGQKELGTKTELKNMNSFKAVGKGIEFEIKRQAEIIDKGEKVVQQTRRWDDAKGETILMRSKEEAHDYRYFPEPDIPPVYLDKKFIEEIKNSIPELAHQRKERYIKEYSIPEYDAGVITDSKDLAVFFEKCVKNYKDAKAVSNLIMGDFLALLKAEDKEIEDVMVSPENLVGLLKLIDKGTISGKIGKEVLKDMFKTGDNPEKIIKDKGLVQINDEEEIKKIAIRIVEDNPKSVEDLKNGKDKALGFLIGQLMKETKGKANPQMANKIFKELID